jgi:autoinducer 2-degrading protein
MWMGLLRSAVLVLALTGVARAQTPPPFVATVVELEVAPAELDKFLAALKENAAASIKEPGCRRYDFMQSASAPNQIWIYEVYENAAAVQAHRETEHFKKYVAATKDLVLKRQSRPMLGILSQSK